MPRAPSARSTRSSCSSARRTGATNGGSSSSASTTPGTSRWSTGWWRATWPPSSAHLRADDAYQRRSVRLLEERNGPRIAAQLTPAQVRVAALVEATVPGMLLVRDGQIDGARLDVPIQFRREPDEAADPDLRDYYCRLLRATDDETFRLGHAIRLEPTAAWPGNVTHEGILARLWVGQHRQLRLAVANLSGEPAQGVHPAGAPRVRRQDRPPRGPARRRVEYDRPGDDLLVRGLYVDLPPYGGHLFRVTRQTTPAAGRRRPRVSLTAVGRRPSSRRGRPARARRPGTGTAGCGSGSRRGRAWRPSAPTAPSPDSSRGRSRSAAVAFE